MGVRATMYRSHKSHYDYPCLKCHENEEKIDNDRVLRNNHRIKTITKLPMILVLFFSEDNVLSDEIKICYIFEYQSNENRAFRFFWDTRYSRSYKQVMYFECSIHILLHNTLTICCSPHA